MKLKDLINKYLQTSYSKMEAQKFISRIDVNVELPEAIPIFIEKFQNEELISEEEFREFSKHLSTLNKNTQECIIHLLYDISVNIYNAHKDDINESVNIIENNIKAGHEIPRGSADEATKYIGLLNCHQLFAHHISIEKGNHFRSKYYSYPEILVEARNAIRYQLPFAINALRVVGKLPSTDDFYGIDLSKPFYPLSLKVVRNEKVPLRKGIKESEEYYPYKMVSKINKNIASGDNTFLATNGKKILFVRGVENYSPKAILSSKIATLISPTHFSSERLLDNRLVGSKGIVSYARSVADTRTVKDRKQYIGAKQVFPGTGIIDEVTNFVHEMDTNLENYGFSSENVYESHLSKIDFDCCDVLSPLSKKNYEQNILTNPSRGMYMGANHVQTNPDYIKEKLFARLKLAMLTEPLIRGLANKAFAPEDLEDKERAIEECINRSNIALELFFEHPEAKSFLTQNPTVLSQCYSEIESYISSHFEENDQDFLQHSLTERVNGVQEIARMRLGVDLSLSSYDGNNPVIEHQLTRREPVNFTEIKSTSIDREVPTKDLETQPKSTFLSRNWLKLLGIGLFSIIGVGTGLALTVTGILAPLGAGVIGLTVSGAVGFGAGIVVGGATFGAKIAYDEYQFYSLDILNSETIDIIELDVVEISPGVKHLEEQVDKAHRNIDKGFATVEQSFEDVQRTDKEDVAVKKHDTSGTFEL
ncbi:Uncharacterised protein [Legionella lansingensis]|uniref:Uncharacterized protein n=1 Tax=Legionella lansingensis TaxID=45067 RepID=A0A0W0VJH3_9GAMM|nr:hypothetical protein [Legionella lansingensis]KTD20258.1 hypothetical protein Llan_1909 [Legionella lansingensis]SNV50262.1 Uncharacterised protein [Legionella lansingensis]